MSGEHSRKLNAGVQLVLLGDGPLRGACFASLAAELGLGAGDCQDIQNRKSIFTGSVGPAEYMAERGHCAEFPSEGLPDGRVGGVSLGLPVLASDCQCRRRSQPPSWATAPAIRISSAPNTPVPEPCSRYRMLTSPYPIHLARSAAQSKSERCRVGLLPRRLLLPTRAISRATRRAGDGSRPSVLTELRDHRARRATGPARRWPSMSRTARARCND